MLAKGIHVSAGTDATRVASYNPWVSLAWLVTGKTVGGLRLYPQRNCLDRETALRMWTENVTWFSNEEGKKGRIEVGQLADLIVPDRDYFACAENEIADTTADLTVVGGKIVYAAGGFAPLDEAAPPPAMPDWSPVRRFGGYGAWADRGQPTDRGRLAPKSLSVGPPRGSRPRFHIASGARSAAPAGQYEGPETPEVALHKNWRARVPARRERPEQRTNDTISAAPRDRRPPIRDHDAHSVQSPVRS